MIIRIVQSKGRKDRHVMLPQEVLDLLREWWKYARRDTTRACHHKSAGCSLGAERVCI
jgi:integrase